MISGSAEQLTAECVKSSGKLNMNGVISSDPDNNQNSVYNPENCKQAAGKLHGNENKLAGNMVYLATTHINRSSQLALNRQSRVIVTSMAPFGIVGAVLSLFSGSNVLSAIAGSAASFYASMFFYLMLQMLQPMLLMGVFCF